MHNAFLAVAAANDNPLLPTVPDLIWGGLAFLNVLVVFIRLVIPRLNALLDARSDAIEGGLKRAEEAQAGAREALEQYNAQLAEARAEAARIREQAREDAKSIRAELVEAASAEAARITANALVTIDAERKSALVSLRSEVGSLAIDLASGVIGETLTDDEKASAIVDRFIADLEAVDRAQEAAKVKA
ncbi:MAG: F-type H+-transporting ATPase subunit b [Actinomycetota bacterium]|nr:F-type H+-transporting ATPase subunit b [Actinomycetota bacterium]